MKIRRGTGLMIVVAVLVVVGLVYMQQASPVRSAGPWYVAPGGSDSNACDVWSAPCAGINGVLAKPGFVAGDTILVAAGTYTGIGAEVVLLNKSTILSGGWDSTFSSQTGQSTFDGGGARRVVKVNSGVNAILERITVQNGHDSWEGGGIYNSGQLMVTDALLQNNSSGWYGSAIYSSGGVLTVTRTTVRNNVNGQEGMYGGGGGAVAFWSGRALIANSSIVNNRSLGGTGTSGIDVSGSSRVTLENTSVSGNTGLVGFGISSSGTMTISNSTIAWHPGQGFHSDFGTVTLANSILAYNGLQGDNRGDCWINGTFTSLGYNLIHSNAGCPLGGTDLDGVDPKLGPLADNGGPTLTHALLPGSPAVDGGNPAGCIGSTGPLATDERGFPRLHQCDIGAYESQAIELAAKTVSRTAAIRHDTLDYRITIPNKSDAMISSIDVNDPLPPGLMYVPNSLSATSGTPTFGGDTITWNGSINAGDTVTISFRATARPLTTSYTVLTNTVSIDDHSRILTRSASVGISDMVWLPFIANCKNEVYGRVTYRGAPVPWLSLLLRFYNGSTWSTYATTLTDAGGNYRFSSLPPLAPGQRYYVRYNNPGNPNYVGMWQTRYLNSFAPCDSVAIGNFDISNISLGSPVPNVTISLPYQFNWGARWWEGPPPDESYELNLFDPTDFNPFWWTQPPLGFTSYYWLNSLPPGFSIMTNYGWFVGVYTPDGGYGESYYYRIVRFGNYGAGVSTLKVPLSPKSLIEDRMPQREEGK